MLISSLRPGGKELRIQRRSDRGGGVYPQKEIYGRTSPTLRSAFVKDRPRKMFGKAISSSRTQRGVQREDDDTSDAAQAQGTMSRRKYFQRGHRRDSGRSKIALRYPWWIDFTWRPVLGLRVPRCEGGVGGVFRDIHREYPSGSRPGTRKGVRIGQKVSEAALWRPVLAQRRRKKSYSAVV